MVAGSRVLVGALVLYCCALTVFTLYVMRQYDLAPLYAWLQPAIVAAAWLSLFATIRGRFAAAGVLLLLTIAAPWGYFYVGPTFAIVVAIWMFRTGSRRTAEASDGP